MGGTLVVSLKMFFGLPGAPRDSQGLPGAIRGCLLKAFEGLLEGFEGSLTAEGFSEQFCLFGKIPIFVFYLHAFLNSQIKYF